MKVVLAFMLVFWMFDLSGCVTLAQQREGAAPNQTGTNNTAGTVSERKIGARQYLPSAVASLARCVRLRMQLKDGSHLFGEPTEEAFAFYAFSAEGRVPFNDIREMAFLPDGERVRVTFMNGDVVTCVPRLGSLNVRTLVGECSVLGERIYEIRVFNHTLYVSQYGMHTGGYTRWSKAATNIQDAVDAANDGDIILVTNGVYSVSRQITVKKGVTVRSVNGPDVTVIDGGMTDRCFFVQHTNAVLEGFTIRHGSATGDGGGVCADGGAIVRRCDIVSNRCVGGWSMGGGAAIVNGGRLESCRISDNQGTRGGGVLVGQRSLMVSCTIRGNMATGEWGGGVLVMAGGKVEQCHVVGNAALRSDGGEGGGVVILDGGCVSRCRIEHNTASIHGAGAYISGLEPSIMTECVVCDNTRPSGQGCGGGVFLGLSGAKIVDSLVVRNHDPSYGGGVYFYDGGSDSGLGGTVVNCTIAMNSSPCGNEVCGGSGQGLLINCIVFNETAENLIGGSDLVFSNSWAGSSVSGTNNAVGDPTFVDFHNGDYRLRPESARNDIGCPLPRLTNVVVGVERILLAP